MKPIQVRELGMIDYEQAWVQMKQFTAKRNKQTADQIWLASHPAVYTLGVAGKLSHLLESTSIPIVRSDRGGQITYHGPGQAIAYLLLDLDRIGCGVRALVHGIEQAVIDLLASEHIAGLRVAKRPGVYVDSAKIAALGLRIKRRCCYHGVSLNVSCNLAPYAAINPCGWEGLQATSLHELGCKLSVNDASQRLAAQLDKQIAALARIS